MRPILARVLSKDAKDLYECLEVRTDFETILSEVFISLLYVKDTNIMYRNHNIRNVSL